MQIVLDRREVPDDKDIVNAVDKELPALALNFLYASRFKSWNKTCAPYPTLFNIKFRNVYYQDFENKNVSFALYGAYYDNRTDVSGAPLIRVLSMVNQIDEKFPKSYCQLWYENKTQPVIIPIVEYKTIWYKKWGNSARSVYPYLLSCIIPEENMNDIPITVSLVKEECDRATNNLKISYELPEKPKTKSGFAVCVKALMYPFEDLSARIVEWLELLRLLGADKIIMYKYKTHKNVTKVLDYYQSTGFIDVRPHTFARGEPNLSNLQSFLIKSDRLNKRLNELVTYNDCFYRNMYKYKYIALIDVDEVIMPLGNWTNWYDIIKFGEQLTDADAKCSTNAGYCFQNVYFPKYAEEPPYYNDLPSYFYMLQHVKRVEKHLRRGMATKCLHNTEYALSLHNHYSLSWVGCGAKDINSTYVQMQHYREPDDKDTLEQPVIDANIMRFKDQILDRSVKVFRKLGFIKS
ncbi:uncharacterized protein LOC119668933 [Teleopsis dalmanni]|uniref:uncharacterized protein LOC119667920 n=1 Tax=Teleopsis dalmanni TaxID=139649 RepID=UPI0018CD12D3|nr:uncharacterized protein LOC119667920 [Teleopsis dalmanni]XP_037934551.1 uncharacterized protein LOC119668933 [Teleopsis dalmanni]